MVDEKDIFIIMLYVIWITKKRISTYLIRIRQRIDSPLLLCKKLTSKLKLRLA